MKMGSVFLSGNDEIMVVDPINEYFDIAETYGGTVVNMPAYTNNYINPLDMYAWKKLIEAGRRLAMWRGHDKL